MADEEDVPQPEWKDPSGENPGPFSEAGKPHGEVRSSQLAMLSSSASGTLTFPPPPQAEDDDEEKPPDTFVGRLDEGIRSGKGKYTWSDGTVYEGEYSNGAKHGAGKLILPDGSHYQGAFVEGVPHGQGVWTYANGDVYKGGFQGGTKHGAGAYHCAKAKCQLVGTFESGAFVHGRWVHADGSYVLGWFEKTGEQQFSPIGEATCKFARPALMQEGTFGPGMAWQGGAITAA